MGYRGAIIAVGLCAACDYGRSRADSGSGTGGETDIATAADGASGTGDGLADSSGDDSSAEPPPIAPDGYYVLGNAIYDAQGERHRFLGVARPSLEWNPEGENLSPDDYGRMASWGANVVRIALNQGFWLSDSVVHDPSYPGRIDENIAWAHAAGLDVILDLHWSDRGDASVTPDQQRMADARSLVFWEEVATRYRDDGRVIFELYNEPHDVIFDVWRNGGPSGDGFEAVGMQALYDRVRATGAENLVLLGGTDWGYDLSRVAGDPVDGYNIAYVSHPYDFPGKQPVHWDADWGSLSESHPVVITEFGSFDCDPRYSAAVIDYADTRSLSWVSWAWFPGGCDFPGLIEDWAGTPSAVGAMVRERLGGG